MAQGEGASLLVRLHGETGEERFAEAATGAEDDGVPVSEGARWPSSTATRSSRSTRRGSPAASSTGRSSRSGATRDVGQGLGVGAAMKTFEALADAMAANIHRFDTGYWSRYDLYPHRLPHVASPAYHLLHIKQLRVLDRLAQRPELAAAAKTFEGYRHSRRAEPGRYPGRSPSGSRSPVTTPSPTASLGTAK